MRLEKPKKAATAAISQTSFSLRARRRAVGDARDRRGEARLVDARRRTSGSRASRGARSAVRQLIAIWSATIDVFAEDAQRGAVRGHAVEAIVFGRYGDDDRLALRARESARSLHQQVMVVHEGAEMFGPLRVRQENVGDEAELGARRLDTSRECRRAFRRARGRRSARRLGLCSAPSLNGGRCSRGGCIELTR